MFICSKGRRERALYHGHLPGDLQILASLHFFTAALQSSDSSLELSLESH